MVKKPKPPSRRAVANERKLKKRKTREGSLRDWDVVDLENGQIGVTCPWCGCKAKLNRRKWIMIQTDFISRGCAYCSKFSWIPERMLPKGDPRL